jgi:hypothetical protein
MKKLVAGVLLLATASCSETAGTSTTRATPPPVNQSVESQKPANPPGTITAPMGESQAIGIAQDPG